MKALANKFIELGIILPQLRAHASRQASAFPYKLFSHAGEFPKFYDDRFRRREPAEVTYIRAKRRSKHMRVAAVVLRSRGREPVPEPIQLLGIDGMDTETVFHKNLHNRTVRHLDSRGDLLRSGLADIHYPLNHLAETFSPVGERALSQDGTALVNNADLVGHGTPVNAREEFIINGLHDKLIPPCKFGSAVITSYSSTGAPRHRLSTGNKITVFGRGACPIEALLVREVTRQLSTE